MIDELKAAIADVRASGEKWDGLAPWSYPGGLAAAFLAKHGPALIAAVELAEAALKADLLLNGGLPFVGTPAEDRFYEALDAYDAAKKENKDA